MKEQQQQESTKKRQESFPKESTYVFSDQTFNASFFFKKHSTSSRQLYSHPPSDNQAKLWQAWQREAPCLTAGKDDKSSAPLLQPCTRHTGMDNNFAEAKPET